GRVERPEAQALRRVGFRWVARAVRRGFLDARERVLEQVRERAQVGLLECQRSLQAAEALLEPADFLLAAVELDLAVVEDAQAATAPLLVVLGRRLARGRLLPAPGSPLALALQILLDLVQLLLAPSQVGDLAVELAHVALQRALAVGLVI